jgi:hypothetical protein
MMRERCEMMNNMMSTGMPVAIMCGGMPMMMMMMPSMPATPSK